MRHLASALSISIALALTGCATSAQGPQTSGRDALTSSISADSLRGHLSFLSSDLLEGRGTPSRGVDLAAEYIAAQFRRAGLEAAGEDGYRDRLSWTPFRSLGHAQAAGEALARLHRASHGFDAPARRQQPLVASFAILAAADPMAAVEAYVEARPALAAFLADRPWRRRLSALFAAAGRGLPAIAARQAPLWTHNDWHPSNLLWSGDGRVRTWLDFGLADRSCAAHDLAIAIERTAFAWLELGQGRDDDLADPLAAETLIAGYRMGVAPDPSVVEASIRLLPLVHVEFALSEIDYFAGIVDDRAAAALAWDTYLLGHAEWFLSPAGRDVCARLSDGGSV